MDVKVIGRVRKILEGLDAASPGDDEQVVLTAQLEQISAQGAAIYQEITRIGRSFQVGTTTAVAAVVAIPSTAFLLALYNAEPDGGRSYIVDWVAALNGASTAVANQAQMLACLSQLRSATISTLTVIPKKMNGLGGGTNDTRARTAVNTTYADFAAADWFPTGPSVVKPGVAATPGYGIWNDVSGRIIIPPGRALGLTVLASVVGETFFTYVGWHEKQLALG